MTSSLPRSRPFVVFEKDTSEGDAPVARFEEWKIGQAAEQVRQAAAAAAYPDPPEIYMYQTVGSLLPQYAMSDWFKEDAHSSYLLRDDAGNLVTTAYPVNPDPSSKKVPSPWVDFSQAEAAAAWAQQIGRWVTNHTVDGIALDGNCYADEYSVSVGGSPGILANISSPARKAAFIAGVNASQQLLAQIIAQARGGKGVLMANGIHRPGDNGMLFEEWCSEHSYLRRQDGCDGSKSRIGCDMEVLQRYTNEAPNSRVVLVHIPDAAASTLADQHSLKHRGSAVRMSASGVVKLAAFLWGAGLRSYFADVPPLPTEKAHWQCDEWANTPAFEEFSKPLGLPTGPGVVSAAGAYTRQFASGASVKVYALGSNSKDAKACIVWGDSTTSGTCT